MGKNLVRDIMANKNIEININNGNGYDVLYPKTILSNVVDWANTIYSKSQTYSRSETYSKSEVDNLLANAGGKKLKFVSGSRKGTGIKNPSQGQEIFTIQTQNTDLVFWAIERDTGVFQGGFSYPREKEIGVINYPTQDHWHMYFNLGTLSSEPIMFAGDSCSFVLTVKKTSVSITVSFSNILLGSAPRDWSSYLMDYINKTYNWIGIGVEN